MTRILCRPRWLATGLGLFGALLLLSLSARPGQAMKEDACWAGTTTLCRSVERCEPNGFDSDGKCRWIYSISRYYWRY